jgi:hypothetical protein
MYGTRGAADGWQEEYSTTLIALGFEQGMSSSCVFRHKERKLACSVHGDDFTVVGGKRSQDWFEKELRGHYELTASPRLGPAEDDAKEGLILNRVVRWLPDGVEYEADPRQAEKIISECGMEGSNSVATPGVKVTGAQLAEDKPLDTKFHTAYRATSARANYLAADRVDCQYASKEVCRWMSSPTETSWAALKRLCRFLCGLPRLVFSYPRQRVDHIDVYVDTDWAGCAKTRRSTNGGCLLLGRHTLKTWSTTQTGVSLSSGEAEMHGVVKGAGVGLGFQSLLADLGIDIPLRVWTDSSAAIGICSRQGLGRLRHLETHTLWVQQAVRSGRVDLRKVKGETNPADLFTKPLVSRERLGMLVDLLGCRYKGGRAEVAPAMRTTQSAKLTIGEVNLLEDGSEAPSMPHLDLTEDELNEHHPSLSVPTEVSSEDEAKWESWDLVYQRGLEIAETIKQRMRTEGRRRIEHEPNQASTKSRVSGDRIPVDAR